MASHTTSAVDISKHPDYTRTEVEIVKGDLDAAYRESLKEKLFPNDAKYLLVALKNFFWKLKKNEVTLSDRSLITKLALQCGKLLGLDTDNTFLGKESHIAKVISSYHAIAYFLMQEKQWDDLLSLRVPLQSLSKLLYLIPDATEREETFKNFTQIIVIYRYASDSPPPAMYFQFGCVLATLMSQLEGYELAKLCSHLTRIITVPGAVKMDNTHLSTLLNSVSFKTPYTELSAEDSAAVNLMFQRIVLHFYESKNAEGPETLQCLIQQGLISESKLNAMKAILKAFLHYKTDAFKDCIRKCRKCLADKALRPELTDLLVAFCQHKQSEKRLASWPARNLQLLAEFVEECLPYISDNKLLSCLVIFNDIVTSVPLISTEDPWEDHKVPGVKLICSLMPRAKNIFQTLDDTNKAETKHVFRNINFSMYKLVSANYFFEAHSLVEVFMQFVFFCKVSLVDDPELLKDLLDCSLIAFTNQFFMCFKNKDATKERKVCLLETGVLMIAAITHTSKFLPEGEEQALLISIMKKWCDLRERLAVTHDFETECCKSLWGKHKNLIKKRFGIEIEAPDWAEITALEIFSYPEVREVLEPMRSAAKVLTDYVDNTSSLNKWWYINLARAHAYNRDDPALALEISTCVVTKLLDAGKDTKTNDILAGLIQAYYQQFISDLSKYRKENEKLGELPLMAREPPLRTGPGGESNAIESWEQAPELSQLGQVLSCRAESRRINPLHLVITHAESLAQMGLDEMDLKIVSATLKVLECTGYIFAALGHYWLAMKCWTVLFDLAKTADNSEIQLIALSMIVSKYCLNPDSVEETWLLQHTAELKKTLTKDKAESFVLQFYSLSYARSLMLSNRNSEAIDIVLSVWKQRAGNNVEQQELQIHVKLLASQLLVRLPVTDPHRKLLKEEFQDPMSAAFWAYQTAFSHNNVKYPAERDPARLRKQELMIDTALWINRLAVLTGCYKMAVTSMQNVLQKLQTLMYCARVAQILACLGDIDLMTPDKPQLDQRLFWNQKILSLGTAIVGGKSEQMSHRTYSVDTSPTRFPTKMHQLTAACSIKCSKTSGGCTLCKNPLFQLCKVHYAFLVTDNEDTVLALCKQLDSDFKERADRLWMFTWKKMLPVDALKSPQSVAGWLHLLVSPITLLECRQRLAIAAVKAAQGRSEAASLVSVVITKLKDVQHETVPLLLGWANSQLVAALMQNRGLGEFASKLQAPKQFANVETGMDYLQVEQPTPPPRTPTPPLEIMKPKQPKRPGRRPTRKESEPSTPICASVPIPKLVLPDTPKMSPAGKTKSENSVMTPKINKPSSKTNCGKENRLSPDTAKLPKNVTKTSRTGKLETPSSFPIFSDKDDKNPVVKTATKLTTKSSTVSSQKKQNPESPAKSNSFKSPLKPCNGAQESPVFSAKSRRPMIVYSDTSPDSPVAKKTTATKEPGKALKNNKPPSKKTEVVKPVKKVVESPVVAAKKTVCLDSSRSSNSSLELVESTPPIASCRRNTVIKSCMPASKSEDSSSTVSSKISTAKRTTVKSRLKSHDSSSEGSILESSIVEVLPKRPTRAVSKRGK